MIKGHNGGSEGCFLVNCFFGLAAKDDSLTEILPCIPLQGLIVFLF